MTILILVLLRGGIATPTEVSVVAVAYGFIVSALVYRDLSVKRVYDALVGTAVTTGVVMLVIAASNLVGYVLIMEDVPNMAAKWTMDVLKSPELVILMMNIIMLFVGMFLRSEEHTSELQSLMRISYAVFCLKKKNTNN